MMITCSFMLFTLNEGNTLWHPIAWVAELVDARDLKSLGACPRESSSLSLGTSKIN